MTGWKTNPDCLLPARFIHEWRFCSRVFWGLYTLLLLIAVPFPLFMIWMAIALRLTSLWQFHETRWNRAQLVYQEGMRKRCVSVPVGLLPPKEQEELLEVLRTAPIQRHLEKG